MATVVSGRPAPAFAQEASPQALVAARELFREATDDVDAGRFDAALGKFRRVAAVKETAAVRFNIGRCEEQVGKLGAALGDYELAAREGSSDPKAAEAAKMAQERAAAIRSRVPRLTITSPKNPPADLVVRLDGETQRGTLGVALPMDPGRHKVEATGGGASFAKDVDLREGAALTVAVDVASASSTGEPSSVSPGSDLVPQPAGGGPNRLPGYIVLGIGAGLGVASVAFLVLHNQAANDLDKQKAIDCTLPGGLCPPSARSTLDGMQSTSQRDQGLAIGFAAGSAVAIGVGLYLVLRSPSGGAADVPKTTTPSARLVPAPGGVMVTGEF